MGIHILPIIRDFEVENPPSLQYVFWMVPYWCVAVIKWRSWVFLWYWTCEVPHGTASNLSSKCSRYVYGVTVGGGVTHGTVSNPSSKCSRYVYGVMGGVTHGTVSNPSSKCSRYVYGGGGVTHGTVSNLSLEFSSYVYGVTGEGDTWHSVKPILRVL